MRRLLRKSSSMLDLVMTGLEYVPKRATLTCCCKSNVFSISYLLVKDKKAS